MPCTCTCSWRSCTQALSSRLWMNLWNNSSHITAYFSTVLWRMGLQFSYRTMTNGASIFLPYYNEWSFNFTTVLWRMGLQLCYRTMMNGDSILLPYYDEWVFNIATLLWRIEVQFCHRTMTNGASILSQYYNEWCFNFTTVILSTGLKFCHRTMTNGASDRKNFIVNVTSTIIHDFLFCYSSMAYRAGILKTTTHWKK